MVRAPRRPTPCPSSRPLAKGRNKLLSAPRWGRGGPLQVASAPRRWGAPDLPSASAGGFSPGISWGRVVRFAFRGEQGGGPARHALGPPPPPSPHLLPLPLGDLEGWALVAEGGSLEGGRRSSAGRGASGCGRPQPRPGRADSGSPTRIPEAWEETAPRERLSEQAPCPQWLVPFQCAFSVSFPRPCASPPTPFSFES